MRRLLVAAALLFTVPSVLACAGLDQMADALKGTPPPPEQQNMVGTWTGGDVTLIIDAEGNLKHSVKGNNSNTEFSAPITEWHDDRIVAGIGPISQEFKIDSPAKRGKGGWKMTINGHELRRK